MIKRIKSRVAIALSLILTIQSVIPVLGSESVENDCAIKVPDMCVDEELYSYDLFEVESEVDVIPKESDDENSSLISGNNELANTDDINIANLNIEPSDVDIATDIFPDKVSRIGYGEGGNFCLTFEEKQYVISRVEQIVSEVIDPDMSDLEKYLALAKWEIENVTYDHDYYDGTFHLEFANHQHDSYGPLKYGKGVCQGITMLYENLCHAAGLACDCVMIDPPVGDGHILNYIPNINGNAYLCDITWGEMFLSIDTIYTCINGKIYTYRDVVDPAIDDENFPNSWTLLNQCTSHAFLEKKYEVPFLFNADGTVAYYHECSKEEYLSGCESYKEKYPDLDVSKAIPIYRPLVYIDPALIESYNYQHDGYNYERAEEPYIEKGSGIRGETHAKYEDYALKKETNTGDWTIDDFYANPVEHVSNITNKDLCEAEITGLRYPDESVSSFEPYDCKTVEEYHNLFNDDIVVHFGDIILKDNVDYTLIFEDSCPKYINEQKMYCNFITIKGIPPYKGSKLVYIYTKEEVINQYEDDNKDIRDAEIIGIKDPQNTECKINEYNTYDECIDAARKDLIIKWHDTILKENVDYSLSYKESIPIERSDCTEKVYCNYITITGINSFTGSVDIGICTRYPVTNKKRSEKNLDIILYEDQTEYHYELSSAVYISVNDPTISSITSDGTVKALKRGATTATVITDDFIYTISILVEGFKNITTEIALVTGEKIQNIDYAKSVNDGNSYSITTSDKNIVAVTSKGQIIAKKPGIAVVTVNKKHSSTTINIKVVAIPKIKFTRNMTFSGQTISGYDFLTNYDTSVPVVRWESSKDSVATISDNGIITAKSTGSANITAYLCEKNKDNAQNSIKISAKITVKVPEFAKTNITMQTGKNMVLSMKNVTGANDPSFVSSDPENLKAIAQTNNKGKTGKALIMASSAGKYTVTAIIDEKEYACEVNVTAPVISKQVTKIKIGKTTSISLKNTKIKKNDVVWESEDPKIASVTTGGKITGISEGTVKIFTETGGVRNVCVVTVY